MDDNERGGAAGAETSGIGAVAAPGRERRMTANLLWIRTFRTVEELRLALINFRQIYNEHWLIQRHGHRSPAQFRRDQMDNLPLAA